MVEMVLQVMSTPAGIESSEERAGGRKVTSDIDWSCWWREAFLKELDCHVLKMGAPLRGAIEPCVSKTGRIMRALASRCGGIS
jgi:hypothetical protein